MSFTSSPSLDTHSERTSRWRDVLLATVASGISTAGDSLAVTTLALSFQSRGASGYSVAALLVAMALPMAALAPLAGRIVDRVDSRTLLVVASGFQAVCAASLACASSTWLIIGLVCLMSSGLAITMPTLAALVPLMVRPQDLPRATATAQTASAIGMLSGPALAGMLVGCCGTRVPLLADAVSYLVVGVASMIVSTRRNAASVTAESSVDKSDESSSWRIIENHNILAILALLAVTVCVANTVSVADVFFVVGQLRGTAFAYGLISATWPAAMMVGAWTAARWVGTGQTWLVRAIPLCLGGVCCVMAVAGLVPSVGFLYPLWILGGIFNGANSTCVNVLLTRSTPEGARGRVFSTYAGVVNVANVLGFGLGGIALAALSPGGLISLAGLVGLGAIALIWWLFGSVMMGAPRAEAGRSEAG